MADGKPIECALDGAAQFSPVCLMVRRGASVVLRHPDGGFRRFEDSGGYKVSAGAFEAQSVHENDQLVLRIEDDRYRWPDGAADD